MIISTFFNFLNFLLSICILEQLYGLRSYYHPLLINDNGKYRKCISSYRNNYYIVLKLLVKYHTFNLYILYYNSFEF